MHLKGECADALKRNITETELSAHTSCNLPSREVQTHLLFRVCVFLNIRLNRIRLCSASFDVLAVAETLRQLLGPLQ